MKHLHFMLIMSMAIDVLPANAGPLNPAQVFGTTGSAPGQFQVPGGIAIDTSGNVWIADGGNHRIQEFTSSGAFIQAFGTSGSNDGQLGFVSGLAIDHSGNVWVTDTTNDRVDEFNSSGAFIRGIGSPGFLNGQFLGPTSVAFDSVGNMWVSDSLNGRIEEFTVSGTFVRSFYGPYGSLERPSVFVDPHDNIWVTDQSRQVQEFNPTFRTSRFNYPRISGGLPAQRRAALPRPMTMRRGARGQGLCSAGRVKAVRALTDRHAILAVSCRTAMSKSRAPENP